MQDQVRNIPYSPEYVDLILDLNKKFEDQTETILSIAQGESVVLKEVRSILLLLKTVNLLRHITQELIFQTSSSLKIVLFTNTSDSVIRSGDINTGFVSLSSGSNLQNDSQIVNLDKIWNEQRSELEIDRILISFKKIIKIISSPSSLTLVGNGSPTLFLLIASKLPPETKQFFYQKDTNTLPERIF